MQKQVLIVDDEEAVCQMVGKVLTAAGLEPMALTSSSEALDLLNQEKFDMVFFDLHMPAPDGMELSRHLRLSRWKPDHTHYPHQRRSASQCYVDRF